MKLKYLLLIPTLLTAMNGMDQIGVGTQSKGMGGVGVALPQDALAAAHNPAGMALLCDRYDIGIDWLNITGNTCGLHSSRNIVFPEIGINYLICRDMSIGISTYLKGAFIADYGKSDPAFGTKALKFSYKQYFLTPSWSWAVTDCHSIGIGVNIAWGVAKIGGLQNLPSAHPTDLTNRGSETEWGVGFTIGWLGHFHDMFSVGLAYESKTWMGRFDKYRGFFPDSGEFNHPSSIKTGVAFHLTCDTVFSADLAYIFWDDIPAFGNRQRKLFGEKGGPGFDWTDQLVLKFGLAYDMWDCLTLRVGYNYGQDPIHSRAKTLNTLTLASIRHHITVGTTYSWYCHELSFAYIHGFKSRYDAKQNQLSLSYGRRF